METRSVAPRVTQLACRGGREESHEGEEGAHEPGLAPELRSLLEADREDDVHHVEGASEKESDERRDGERDCEPDHAERDDEKTLRNVFEQFHCATSMGWV